MRQDSLNINYEIFDLDELSEKEKELIDNAVKATEKSYSPYSNFKVGCAVRLDNGEIVLGANQENIAYPSGLCAERTALFSAGMKDNSIECMAIAAFDEKNNPATAYPCGACRQVMAESQKRQEKPIKLLLLDKDKRVLKIDNLNDLLPFGFEF